MTNRLNRNLQRGFTLIELLVVIAIIGILSSVVLASLNSARGKGANGAVQSNLDNMRAQAEIVYDGASPNSYDTVCNPTQDTTIAKALTSAESAGGATSINNTFTAAGASTVVSCHSASGTYLISAPLKAPYSGFNYWCVDNTGNSKPEANAVAGSATGCI